MAVTPDPSALNPAAVLITAQDTIRWGIGEVFRDAGREVNANPGVPWMCVVRASFAGYTTEGDPIFVFFYPNTQQDTYLPPHDHSSNNPADGGFAFSVFHPGTEVVSLPYAL